MGCVCISCSKLLLAHVTLSSTTGVRGTPQNTVSGFGAEEIVVFHAVYGEDGGLIAIDVVEAKNTNNFAWMGIFLFVFFFFLICLWEIGGCEQSFGPWGAMYSTAMTRSVQIL